MNPPSYPSLTSFPDLDFLFQEGQYATAIDQFQEAIDQQPEQVAAYWYLGLAFLLNGQEEEAQVTWMIPLLDANPEQAEPWLSELACLLHYEAARQDERGNGETAWLIRQHLREFVPNDLENLLHLLRSALQAQIFSFEDNLLAIVTEALETEVQSSSGSQQVSADLLLKLAQGLLDLEPTHPDTVRFIATTAALLTDSLQMQLIHSLLHHATGCREARNFQATLDLCALCERLVPNHFDTLFQCVNLLQYGDLNCLMQSIALAEQCLSIANNAGDRFMAINGLLSSWIYSGGNGQRSMALYQDYKTRLAELVRIGAKPPEATPEANPEATGLSDPELGFVPALLAVGGLCFYFEDNPQRNRPLRNQVAQIAQTRLQEMLQPTVQRYQQQRQQRQGGANLRSHRQLKIGYLAGSLRQHSVGWLCRWLFQHHDENQVEVHLYSARQSNDPIQQSLRQQYGDRFHDVPASISEIADRICADEIDILVELDSLTSLGGCGTVALKPAPIQVHWLGFDASGIPGVDYFIADPYVLPENAQEYYRETIWRLPHTYLAIDGFEVGVPSLRREELGIPADAVVYFSGQTGMKRNADLVRSQFQILKQVPGSYFLIKSFKANPEFVKDFFQQVASEVGISGDRLRFLPDVPSELTHRANLSLADVVLDTYPYNGATTTLEALWMGLPIVTRVGEQFAARNSYTMMRNVGITAGISWTEDEYINWGVRLGQDIALREDIGYRLRQSRHTSPLWNTQQFARDMEKAYLQMWERYLER